jgi:hypothetical protein
LFNFLSHLVLGLTRSTNFSSRSRLGSKNPSVQSWLENTNKNIKAKKKLIMTEVLIVLLFALMTTLTLVRFKQIKRNPILDINVTAQGKKGQVVK